MKEKLQRESSNKILLSTCIFIYLTSFNAVVHIRSDGSFSVDRWALKSILFAILLSDLNLQDSSLLGHSIPFLWELLAEAIEQKQCHLILGTIQYI